MDDSRGRDRLAEAINIASELDALAGAAWHAIYERESKRVVGTCRELAQLAKRCCVPPPACHGPFRPGAALSIVEAPIWRVRHWCCRRDRWFANLCLPLDHAHGLIRVRKATRREVALVELARDPTERAILEVVAPAIELGSQLTYQQLADAACVSLGTARNRVLGLENRGLVAARRGSRGLYWECIDRASANA